jgi:hypothetical protein
VYPITREPRVINLSCVERNRLNVPLFADPVNLSATTGVIFCGTATDGARRYRGVIFYCAWPVADTNNLPATVGVTCFVGPIAMGSRFLSLGLVR